MYSLGSLVCVCILKGLHCISYTCSFYLFSLFCAHTAVCKDLSLCIVHKQDDCVKVFRSSLYIVYIVYMKPFLGVFHYAKLFRRDFSMCVEHTHYSKDVPYGAVLKDLGKAYSAVAVWFFLPSFMQLTFVSRSYLDTERGCQVVVNVPATTGSKRSLPSVHHGNYLLVTAFSFRRA